MPKEASYGICPYKVVNRSFCVLLNKTSKKSHHNFFKGKSEKNETIKETAIREFKEETGVLLQERDLELCFFQSNKKKNIGIFLVDWASKKENFIYDKKEIYEAGWVHITAITEVANNQRKIYNSITTYLTERQAVFSVLKYI